MNENKKAEACVILSKNNINNINIEYNQLKEQIKEKIIEINSKGIYSFFCIYNYGISLPAAEAIIELRKLQRDLKLNIIILYKGYELNFLRSVMEKCSKVYEEANSMITLNNMYSDNDFMAVVYAEKTMMDYSKVLLIDENKYGAINYAESNGLEVIKLFK